MGFYEQRILPHVINLAMRNRELLPYRRRVLERAEGRVLEIGIGSGLNLPHYPASSQEIVGLDGVYERTEADDLHVRGLRPAAIARPRLRDSGTGCYPP